MSEEANRYVIHVPVVAANLRHARILARTAARALAFLAVDTRETTVSEEDNQNVHHRVFCNRLLADGQRCALRAEHETECAPRVPR